MSRRIAVAGGASLAAALILSVVPARAETLYFGGEGGWTLLQDQKITSAGLPTATERFNSGFAVGARIGYEEGPWRFEAEYAYRRNDADASRIGGATLRRARRQPPVACVPGQSDLRNRFRLAGASRISAPASARSYLIGPGQRARAVGTFFNDNTWEIRLSGDRRPALRLTPNIAVDLDYRYFATTDPTFRMPRQRHLQDRLQHAQRDGEHRLPPRPAGPAAADRGPPAPPRRRRWSSGACSWSSSTGIAPTITPRRQRIIEQAAAAYRAGAPVQIEVTGHTDRSGSPGYNQRLSERRADAVAAALVRLRRAAQRDGGQRPRRERQPLVPTADGVREPQNRRVEIVFP